MQAADRALFLQLTGREPQRLPWRGRGPSGGAVRTAALRRGRLALT